MSLFDLSPPVSPWTTQFLNRVESQRHVFRSPLFIDDLLSLASVTLSYPPTSPEAFEALYDAIQDSPTFEAVKRDSLVYYLLKAWGDGREANFANMRALPEAYRIVADGYWAMDVGDIETAVHYLSDSRVTPDFTSKILHCLTRPTNPELIKRYVRFAKPILSITPSTPGEPSDVEIYLSALCEDGLHEAWLYQRKFANAQKENLIHRILEFSLIPRPKTKHCKQLLTYPFSATEQEIVTGFALSPPPSLSATSLSILRDLILVRLVHSGGYAEAIKLSKRWGGEGKEVILGLVDVLPDVQKRLLELNLDEKDIYKERDVPASMMMSWETLDKSTASSSFMHASQMAGSTSSGLLMSNSGSGLLASSSGSGLLASVTGSGLLASSPGGRLSALGTPRQSQPFSSSVRPRIPAAPFGILQSSSPRRSPFGFPSSGGGGGVVLGKSTQAARLSLLNSSSPLSKTVLAPSPSIVRQPFQTKPFQAEDNRPFESEDRQESLRQKRSFNQVAQSPTQREADMSLSELRVPPRQESDEEENDDDVVLNASRPQRYPLRRLQKVVEEEKKEDEAMPIASSTVPGAFPEEQDEEEAPIRLTRARTRASVEPQPQVAPVRKAATSKKAAGKKPIMEDPEAEAEPEPVRRSSRVNAKTTSPDRKKARSSAEPDASAGPARRSSRTGKEKEKASPVKKRAGRKGWSIVEE